MRKVASKPECRKEVGAHDLSPLKDKILIGILEAVRVHCEAEVVPRYIRPLPTLVGEGLFYFQNTRRKIMSQYRCLFLSAHVEPDIAMSLVQKLRQESLPQFLSLIFMVQKSPTKIKYLY